MMQYCVYLRKSRADEEAEERGEVETLLRHERTLLELAKKLRLNVTQIYREVVSGETIAARPVMQHLLSEVESGFWGGVLVMEVERLARGDTIDQGIMAQTFKFSNTKIITPLKTYDPNNEFDEEYFEFGLFMSRREYKTINRRLQRGRIASVKEGKYVGNKSPYGYRRVKIEHDKGYTLERVPEEADLIRMIFDLYTIGELQPDDTYKRLGVSLIVRRLNAMNVPTKTGGKWVVSSVRDILINPVYAGKVRWNWRHAVKKMVDGKIIIERPRASSDEYIVVPGIHPAIVDEAVFETAQEIMRKNPPRPISERYTVKNPLSGLVICGKCGRHMIRRPYGARRPQDTLMCPVSSCSNVSCDLHYVEEHILASLSDWLNDYRLEWDTTAMPKSGSQWEFKRKAAKRLRNGLDSLDKQLNNIHDLFEQGVYTKDVFLARSRLISERIKVTHDDLDVVEKDLAFESTCEDSRRNIIPKTDRLLETYHELPDAKAKNDMLKEILEKVIYVKDQRTRWHGSPDDFEIFLFPKLPPNSEIK